jgi:chromosome segregation ATPase
MSKETTQEASAVHVRQVQYDRRIADLNLNISKLQSAAVNKEPSDDGREVDAAKANDDEMAKQIKMLSEEVLRLRDKVGNHHSESLALKSRLRSATDRAANAEGELAAVRVNENDIESAPAGGNGLSRRKRGGGAGTASIRAAMSLNPGQGDGRENIGKAIDVVDSFAVSTGTFYKSCE